MDVVCRILLANAIAATVLAIAVAAITRVIRHPPLTHFLWLLVLLKLVTPPLRSFEVPIPGMVPATEISAVTRGSIPGNARVGTAIHAAAEHPQPVNCDRPTTGLGQGGGPAEIPVVQPPSVNLDRPLLAKISRPSNKPNALEGGAGRLTPAVLSSEGSETAVIPKVPPALAPWAWESSLSVAGWVWLAGSVLWFTVVVVRVVRFDRCRRQAELAPASLQAETHRLAQQLGLACCPVICVVHGRMPPLLWAMTGKATILLPALLIEQMPPSQQAMVVAHEMAHFARRDHWLRWLDVFVLGIYWWFPVAWWARRQVHHAAEQCCDAWVVWLFPDGARSYARSLVETIDFLSQARPFLPVGASSLGQFHFHSLKRRLHMILSKSTTRRMSWPLRITAVSMGLAVLAFSVQGVWGQGTVAKTPEIKADPPTIPQAVPPGGSNAMGQHAAGGLTSGGSLPSNTSVLVVPPQQNNVEARLQRLEAVTDQILQELKSLRNQNTAVAGNPTATSGIQLLHSDPRNKSRDADSNRRSWVAGIQSAADLKPLDARIATASAPGPVSRNPAATHLYRAGSALRDGGEAARTWQTRGETPTEDMPFFLSNLQLSGKNGKTALAFDYQAEDAYVRADRTYWLVLVGDHVGRYQVKYPGGDFVSSGTLTTPPLPEASTGEPLQLFIEVERGGLQLRASNILKTRLE